MASASPSDPTLQPPVETPAEAPTRTPRTHLTDLPRGFVTVRILQLLASIIILGLTIFGMVYSASVTVIIGLITSVISAIILIWIIVATYCAPSAYNYWAVLAMEIFSFLLWIDGFIWLLAAAFDGSYDQDGYCDSDYDDSTGSYDDVCYDTSPTAKAYGIAMILCASLGAALIILFLVSLVVISVFIARHRAAAGHSTLGSEPRGAYVSVSQIQKQDWDLRKQNLDLQQKYLDLQQKHLELQQRENEEQQVVYRMSEHNAGDIERGGITI